MFVQGGRWQQPSGCSLAKQRSLCRAGTICVPGLLGRLLLDNCLSETLISSLRVNMDDLGKILKAVFCFVLFSFFIAIPNKSSKIFSPVLFYKVGRNAVWGTKRMVMFSTYKSLYKVVYNALSYPPFYMILKTVRWVVVAKIIPILQMKN